MTEESFIVVSERVNDRLVPHLDRTPEDDRPVVLMTCGLAGSGKTTLTKAIREVHPTFHRISIDEIIYQRHGMHGFSYPASCDAYAHYQAEADVIYLSRFHKLLSEGKDIILERSFYAKDDRDQFRSMAEDGGARVVLVFLRAHDREVLWQRVCKRSRGVKTPDSALEISKEEFEAYYAGFEDPVGEEEIVIDVLP